MARFGHSTFLALGLVVSLNASAGSVEGYSPAVTDQAKSVQKPPTAPSVPQLTGQPLAAIQEFAKDPKDCRYQGPGPQCRLENDFWPLVDYADGSSKVVVSSTRGTIALLTWKASTTNGRYTPPPNQPDTVQVQCGDSDLGDIFECARVRLLTPEKRVVKPVSYAAGPRAYRNALGARWSVREVLAVYAIRELREGFSVDYASFNGTEWTFEVSAEDARNRLFLKIGETVAPAVK